jgi:hypothetical protein
MRTRQLTPRVRELAIEVVLLLVAFGMAWAVYFSMEHAICGPLC